MDASEIKIEELKKKHGLSSEEADRRGRELRRNHDQGRPQSAHRDARLFSNPSK